MVQLLEKNPTMKGLKERIAWHLKTIATNLRQCSLQDILACYPFVSHSIGDQLWENLPEHADNIFSDLLLKA